MENYNSFGRKIKDCFSITFKKDEDILKVWLNEQVSPVSYIKQLVMNDMKKNKVNLKSLEQKQCCVKDYNYSKFNFNMEE